MNIQAKEFEMIISHGELFDLYIQCKIAVLHEVRMYWVNHQESFKSKEQKRVCHYVERFSIVLGRPDLYHEVLAEIDDIFKTFNEFNRRKA